MINWTEMSSLHVISKLEEILNKWYGVELFWTDMHYKIRSNHLEKDHDFYNQFMKVQMNMKC